MATPEKKQAPKKSASKKPASATKGKSPDAFINMTIILPDGSEYKIPKGIPFWENDKVPNAKLMHFLNQMAKGGKTSVEVKANLRIVDNRETEPEVLPDLVF